jgi:hypothetical protein
VNVNWQLATPGVAVALRRHCPEAGANAPVVGLDVKLTKPVGVTLLEPVSLTVAVQVVGCPTVTGDGTHATVVEEGLLTNTVNWPPAAACPPSPG